MKITFSDVPCSVENCGMNGLSSVRIDDHNWFTLCVEHSIGTDHHLHEGVLDSDSDRHVYEDDRGEWRIGIRPGVDTPLAVMRITDGNLTNLSVERIPEGITDDEARAAGVHRYTVVEPQP